MTDVGSLVWQALSFKAGARKDTLDRYRRATVEWLNDPDVKSSIDKFGISQGTYRKYMGKTVLTNFPLLKDNSDWKLKLFSVVGLRPCARCNTLRNFASDFCRDQKTCKFCQQEYREQNRDIQRAYTKEHYQENKGEYKARAALRKAHMLKATPAWANLLLIEEIYNTCPEGFHVDHIVPLQGETVCGLHVEYNLRHLEASLNISKSNKLVEDLIYG